MEITATTTGESEIMLVFDGNKLIKVYVYNDSWDFNSFNFKPEPSTNRLFSYIKNENWKEFFSHIDIMYLENEEINLRKRINLINYIDSSKITYIN